MIYFDEASHTYTNTKTKEKYVSVTTLLGKYKTPFDADLHATRVANKNGVPKEMVLEMWQQETKVATDRGTKIHKLMENYINSCDKNDEYYYLYESYDSVVSESIDKFKGVNSELLLHNNEFKIAGTSDLIYDQGDYFTISDFKTNKKFKYSSDFNDYFKAPISHLQYCEHNVYALQMSLYAKLYEEMTNKKCKKIVVFYLKDDKWIDIHCNYLKLEVEAILKDYRLNNFK